MTTDLPALAPDRVERGLEWLEHSLKSPQRPPKAEMQAAICALMRPIDPHRCGVLVSVLMDNYFEKETPQNVREEQARHWLDDLCQYPEWAVERSVRWWTSAENPDRRKRPLIGDIVARTQKEIGLVSLARAQLALGASEPEKPRERVTPEAMDRIRREVGFMPFNPSIKKLA